MAAVLCLVMLPLFAAVGFMFGVMQLEWSAASVLGCATFIMLAGGLLVGAFRLSHGWDSNES